MERLLYESKGAPTRATTSFVLGGIFLPICGLFFIIIANMKRNGLYISTGHNSGYIGGGYMISEEGRMTFTVIGICVIVLGVIFLFSLIPVSKTTFQIFERHIEGMYYLPILGICIRRDYYYNFNQIMGVQIDNFVIILHTTMGTKRIALKNRERAREVFQWIQYLLQQYPVQRY